jgi:hypothetical protein
MDYTTFWGLQLTKELFFTQTKNNFEQIRGKIKVLAE